MPASDGRRFALTSEPVLPMTASSLKRWGPEAPVERLRFSARSAPPKSRRSRSRTLVNPLAVASAPHGQSDQSVSLSVGLPVLRFQYVARSVRVLVGSRWKLQQFQDKTLALRTGDKPSLLLFPPDSDATGSRPDEMLPLPLDTMCQLTSSRAGSTLNGLKLSSHAADRSFRVRVRFATQADAAIWSRVVQDAMRHARWSQRLEPLPLSSTGSPPVSSSRVRSRVEGAVHGPTRRQYVVKVLDQNDGLNCNEVRILKKLATAAALRSRALVGGYRVIETANDVRVVMPRLPGRSLLHFLHHSPRPSRLAEDEAKTLMVAICEQLQALHGAGIVHCDLKLENVVLADFLTARLIDFGGAYDLSTITDKHCHEPVDTTMVGTPGYIAPERILRPTDPPTSRADVFSLGVMLFQLLAGHHPFTDAARRHRPLQLADSLRLDWTKAQTLLLMRGVSSDARDLVRRMLVSDPMARISVDEILRSPWLAKQ